MSLREQYQPTYAEFLHTIQWIARPIEEGMDGQLIDGVKLCIIGTCKWTIHNAAGENNTLCIHHRHLRNGDPDVAFWCGCKNIVDIVDDTMDATTLALTEVT